MYIKIIFAKEESLLPALCMCCLLEVAGNFAVSHITAWIHASLVSAVGFVDMAQRLPLRGLCKPKMPLVLSLCQVDALGMSPIHSRERGGPQFCKEHHN